MNRQKRLISSYPLEQLRPNPRSSVLITPTPKGDAAQVIGTGMQLYGITRELRNRAKTKQRGDGNGAAISQNGRGNNALIVQRGNGNTGTITQNGNCNSYGLFQFGRHNSGNVVQNGDSQVGLTFQGNW